MTTKILAVDDDPQMRKTVGLLLEQRGYEVLQAGGGQEALELIARERPRLMIVDQRMPGMDGLQVIKAARGIDNAILVIMLTSEQDLESAQRALDLGAVEYVTKPFDAEFLRAEVDRLLDSADHPKKSDPWGDNGVVIRPAD